MDGRERLNLPVNAPPTRKVGSRVNGYAVWRIFKHGSEYFQRLCIPFPVAEGPTRTNPSAVSSSYNLGRDLGRRPLRRVTLRDLLIECLATAVQFRLGCSCRDGHLIHWNAPLPWIFFKAAKATLILPIIISALDACGVFVLARHIQGLCMVACQRRSLYQGAIQRSLQTQRCFGHVF